MRALKNEKLAIIIGCNLIRIRRKAQLTQEQVAEMAGIRPTLYEKYEAGKSLVSIQNLVKLAHTLNVTVDELLFTVLEIMQEEADD